MMLLRIIFVVLIFICLNASPYAYGADLLSGFQPYISVKGDYSDNLNLTSTNKREDFITTVQPGIRYSSTGKTSGVDVEKISGVDLDYALGAVFYNKYTDLNYISHRASLNARYLSSAHINFYLKESFTRSDDPREREYYTAAEDNRYVLATRTDRNVYWRNVITPTIEYQFGPENRVGVNYRNNIYETQGPAANNSREHYVNPFITYWFDKQNGISLEYGYTDGAFDTTPDLKGHKATGRYTNRFSQKSSAFAEYTYLQRTFDSAPTRDYSVHEPTVGMIFALGPTLTASAQAGYFVTEPQTGPKKEGISYKGELANTDPRTTYKLSAQGGYTEDYFTSENLGFNKYHRVIGSVSHKPAQRMSVGCFGSVEWAEFENPLHKDTVWGVGASASYMPLKWLTLALELSHKNRQSDVSTYEYKENRGMFTVTAQY